MFGSILTSLALLIGAAGFEACAVAMIQKFIVPEGGGVRGNIGKVFNILMHWLAITFAFIGGMLLWSTPIVSWLVSTSLVRQYGSWVAIPAAVIAVVCLLADVIPDKKPDLPAVIATFLIPALLVIATAAWPSVSGQIGHTGHNWGTTVQSNVGR